MIVLKIVGIIGIAVVVLVAGFLIYAATRPDAFRTERSASVKAPPEKIFALINDLHQWVSWSPWEKIDPALKRTHSGAASGKGAVYAWEGNNKVGSGSMEILDTIPASRITIKLDFIKPFEGHNTAEFKIERAGDSTTVTWAMFGPSPYLSKVMGLVFSMDKMIGDQFETGLANLKAIAEK
jgi:uncharacterized protein YndB with AHSA1/START domain